MQVEECFKHELINKLSEIVMFEPLSHDELREIVRIQMKGVIATVADKGVSLFASDAALDVICSKSHNDVSIRYLNKPNTYMCA
jgi:ATP-dependent Clp protease ATP-binding subunit ClpA